MKNVVIKSIKIENFKGNTREVKFNENKETLITGANGVGKSTVFKSLCWLLTGKTDAQSKANSELYDNTKELTPDTPMASVSAVLSIDGVEHTLTRTAKAKFKRPKGSAEYVKDSSDDYGFEIDGMKYKSTDFDGWVEYNIAPVGLLPICLNGDVFALQAQNKPLDARKTLTGIIGEQTPADVSKYAEIAEYTASEGGIERLVGVCNSSVNALNDKLSEIPVKKQQYEKIISELKRQIADSVDYYGLVSDLDIQIEQVKKAMQDEQNKVNEQNAEYFRLNARLSELNAVYPTKIAERNATLKHIEDYSTHLAALEGSNASDTKRCPACGSLLKKTDIDKAELLKRIAETKDTINSLDRTVDALNAEIASIDKERDEIVLPEYKNADLSDFNSRINDLWRQRSDAASNATIVKNKKQQLVSFEAVVVSLKESWSQTASELALWERKRILADEYSQKCAEMLSEKINGLMPTTRIEMFDVQKNGERKPSCVITNADGVKYSTLNYSARLIANVEISRMFCGLLGVNLPCFVDECSVFDNNHLPNVDGAQMVYIKCSDDKELIVL